MEPHDSASMKNKISSWHIRFQSRLPLPTMYVLFVSSMRRFVSSVPFQPPTLTHLDLSSCLYVSKNGRFHEACSRECHGESSRLRSEVLTAHRQIVFIETLFVFHHHIGNWTHVDQASWNKRCVTKRTHQGDPHLRTKWKE